MEQTCHRCGAAVGESAPFCPHCGAPQLRYEAPDESAPAAPSAAPSQHATAHNPGAVHWREAVRAAAIIAFPAGLLSSRLGLQGIWIIWLVAGGMVVLSIYRRRTGTLATKRMGWRIGALFGLFAAVIAAAVDGISLVVQRFALQQGTVLDQHYRDAIQMSSKLYAGLFSSSNPQMASAISNAERFWYTPNGAAAMVLINAAGLAIFMLIFAAAGGALGARLSAKSAQASMR